MEKELNISQLQRGKVDKPDISNESPCGKVNKVANDMLRGPTLERKSQESQSRSPHTCFVIIYRGKTFKHANTSGFVSGLFANFKCSSLP